MPRQLKHIAYDHERQEVLALDESGLIWFGKLRQLSKFDEDAGETLETDDHVIEWQPIQGPPDGVHYTEAKLSFWDDMEKRAREIAKRYSDDGGKAVPLAASEESDSGTDGETVQATSDHDLEDGEGQDTSL